MSAIQYRLHENVNQLGVILTAHEATVPSSLLNSPPSLSGKLALQFYSSEGSHLFNFTEVELVACWLGVSEDKPYYKELAIHPERGWVKLEGDPNPELKDRMTTTCSTTLKPPTFHSRRWGELVEVTPHVTVRPHMTFYKAIVPEKMHEDWLSQLQLVEKPKPTKTLHSRSTNQLYRSDILPKVEQNERLFISVKDFRSCKQRFYHPDHNVWFLESDEAARFRQEERSSDPGEPPLTAEGDVATWLIDFGFMHCMHWPTLADAHPKLNPIVDIAIDIGWLDSRGWHKTHGATPAKSETEPPRIVPQAEDDVGGHCETDPAGDDPMHPRDWQTRDLSGDISAWPGENHLALTFEGPGLEYGRWIYWTARACLRRGEAKEQAYRLFREKFCGGESPPPNSKKTLSEKAETYAKWAGLPPLVKRRRSSNAP